MSEHEKSVTEHLADAQDTLYTLEESARGLRTKMRENGWMDESSERVAAHWLMRSIDVGINAVNQMSLEKTQDTGWNLLGKVLAITAGLFALPAIIFLSIAGFRWALG